MKLKNLLCLILVYALTCSGAFATKIPDNVSDYIRKEIPNVAIRFDGLITFPDKTVYLPVIPSKPNKEGKGVVAITYPAGKTLLQKPDVVVFDTNYALLKVLKNKQGRPTFADSNNIPLGVKTGVLPQDLLVPPGMIIPDDLKILLGDLNIPTVGSAVNNFFVQGPRVAPVKASLKIVPVSALKDKTLLMTNLENTTVNVVPSDATIPSYTLKLESLPRFIEPVENDKYLMVAATGKTYIDVADLKLEVLAKKIDLSYHPSEIVVSKNKAYVGVSDDQSIFVIDLKSMAVLEKIKIKGYPKCLSLDKSGNYLAYVDKTTGNVFTLDISNSAYENKFLVNCPNVSKLLAQDSIIYALSRTENQVRVIDTKIQEVIYEQDISPKPVDLIAYNGFLYVLSASNQINIFNMTDYQIVKTEKLKTNGFSKQIVQVGTSNYAIITNAADKKYFVFDMKKNEVVQTVPSDIVVTNLKIINKPMK